MHLCGMQVVSLLPPCILLYAQYIRKTLLTMKDYFSQTLYLFVFVFLHIDHYTLPHTLVYPTTLPSPLTYKHVILLTIIEHMNVLSYQSVL